MPTPAKRDISNDLFVRYSDDQSRCAAIVSGDLFGWRCSNKAKPEHPHGLCWLHAKRLATGQLVEVPHRPSAEKG